MFSLLNNLIMFYFMTEIIRLQKYKSYESRKKAYKHTHTHAHTHVYAQTNESYLPYIQFNTITSKRTVNSNGNAVENLSNRSITYMPPYKMMFDIKVIKIANCFSFFPANTKIWI